MRDMSPCSAWLPTLRCTNTSPGARARILDTWGGWCGERGQNHRQRAASTRPAAPCALQRVHMGVQARPRSSAACPRPSPRLCGRTGTRESLQPMYMNSGSCCPAWRAKKPGSASRTASAQRLEGRGARGVARVARAVGVRRSRAVPDGAGECAGRARWAGKHAQGCVHVACVESSPTGCRRICSPASGGRSAPRCSTRTAPLRRFRARGPGLSPVLHS